MNPGEANTNKARSERGAALIMVLLISTLLVITGGALVLVTGLSTRTAIDATAEMQAYYAAESGLQDTLNVLRGNVSPMGGMPANSKIDFLKAVTPNQSNKSNDHSGIAHLSGWLNYNYSGTDGNPDRVALTANYSPLNGLAYNVEVSDPDAATTPANTEPARLLLRVHGFGPKNAEKRLELIVKRTSLDYAPPAMLMIRGADDCNPAVNFTAGDSAAKDYSGHDRASSAILPTFGATCSGDTSVELNADTKNTVVSPKASTIPISNLPVYLQTTDGPQGARAYLYGDEGLMSQAIGQQQYYTSYNGSPNGGLTFVDGNCVLTGGSGLLVVTGTLTLNGNPSFDGLILVLGDGIVQRSGAGNGELTGAMAVARFNRTSGPFLAPTFNTDGAGTSLMQYDSDAVRRALNASGPLVQGVHEY